jgi:hypothetical protein
MTANPPLPREREHLKQKTKRSSYEVFSPCACLKKRAKGGDSLSFSLPLPFNRERDKENDVTWACLFLVRALVQRRSAVEHAQTKSGNLSGVLRIYRVRHGNVDDTEGRAKGGGGEAERCGLGGRRDTVPVKGTGTCCNPTVTLLLTFFLFSDLCTVTLQFPVRSLLLKSLLPPPSSPCTRVAR